MIRQHPEHAYRGLKAATRLAVRDVGGIDAVAAATRATRSLVSDYQNNNETIRFMPADIILDVEAIAGTPHITAALARIQGYELRPVETSGPADIPSMMARIGTEASTAFATLGQAMADGVISTEERMNLERDLDALIRAASEARARLHGGRQSSP